MAGDLSLSVCRTHELRTWPDQFQAVLDGRKPFEVRQDDRGYTEGDTIILKEWRPYLPNIPATARISGFGYTGRWVTATVRYVCPLGDFGCNGFVAMTIEVTDHGR